MLAFLFPFIIAQIDPGGMTSPGADAVSQAIPQVGAGGVLGLLAGGGPLALLARSLYQRLEKAEERAEKLEDRVLRLEIGVQADLRVIQSAINTTMELVKGAAR